MLYPFNTVNHLSLGAAGSDIVVTLPVDRDADVLVDLS
jgi:hypothetical protein